MRYYISDLHFYHEGLNERMDKRGFADADAMNRYMIEHWNSRVRKHDDVIVLGDFSVGRGTQTNEILEQLSGYKYLVTGNHDKFLDDRSFDRSLFRWVEPYMELKDNKRKVVLSHYPIFCYNGQYRRDGEGNPKTYMLYGHVHDTFDELLVNRFQEETRACKRQLKEDGELVRIPCSMINCFCMFSDYVPLTLDEWIELDEKRRKVLACRGLIPE